MYSLKRQGIRSVCLDILADIRIHMWFICTIEGGLNRCDNIPIHALFPAYSFMLQVPPVPTQSGQNWKFQLVKLVKLLETHSNTIYNLFCMYVVTSRYFGFKVILSILNKSRHTLWGTITFRLSINIFKQQNSFRIWNIFLIQQLVKMPVSLQIFFFLYLCWRNKFMSCQRESLFFLRGHGQFLLNVQSGSRLRQIQNRVEMRSQQHALQTLASWKGLVQCFQCFFIQINRNRLLGFVCCILANRIFYSSTEGILC